MYHRTALSPFCQSIAQIFLKANNWEWWEEEVWIKLGCNFFFFTMVKVWSLTDNRDRIDKVGSLLINKFIK